MRWVALLALVAACTGPFEGTEGVGKVWVVQSFVERRAVAGANAGQTFGGWAPADLVSEPGAGLLFSPKRLQADGFGLTVFPGVSEGAPLGFIITDIWQDHPAPWVQPVYSPLGPPLPDGGPNPLQVVFPVGVASSFYSPWWFQEFFDVAADAGSPSSSKAALEAGPRFPGALVLCPIITLSDGTEVRVSASLEPSSDGGAAVGVTRHPLTGQRLQSPGTASAWVDGETVKYLRLGAGRGRAEGQQLIESPMYVFTVGGTPLLTTAVLPPGAASRGLVRRWDVPLPASAGIFVPADKPEWRDALLLRRPDAGVERSFGTRADAGVGEFHEYGLRVARDKQCFDAPDFPTSCAWLDSEARVLQLGTARKTKVLLTIAVLGAQP